MKGNKLIWVEVAIEWLIITFLIEMININGVSVF